jgi:hypothetical protein
MYNEDDEYIFDVLDLNNSMSMEPSYYPSGYNADEI